MPGRFKAEYSIFLVSLLVIGLLIVNFIAWGVFEGPLGMGGGELATSESIPLDSESRYFHLEDWFRERMNDDIKTQSVETKDTKDYIGYIVTLKEDPIIKVENEFKKIGIQPMSISNELIQQETRINEQQTRVKNYINSIISDSNIGKSFKKVINGFEINVDYSEIEKIKTHPDVEDVVPNYIVEINLNESVPLIKADQVWELNSNLNPCNGTNCLTGEGIKIGILDTGADYTHTDLGSCTTDGFLAGNCSKVIGGWDFVLCDYFNLFTGECHLPKSEDQDPMDQHGHGTHVAATAAGNGVLKGVAPEADIVAYRVLNNQGIGLYSWIISASSAAFK